MIIENCTIDDFNEIRESIIDFWGSDRTLYLHHPMLIYEFGNSAFVIRSEESVMAYLFGFLSQTEKTGYVHLVGVREKYRGRGLAKLLYQHFIDFSLSHGSTKLKAITTDNNNLSIAFHTKMGMTMLGEKNENGIPVIRNYSGKGMDRVVFEKQL